jgi:hypothetical protein
VERFHKVAQPVQFSLIIIRASKLSTNIRLLYNAQPSGVRCTTADMVSVVARFAEREQQADCDQLGLSEHTVKNYLFHVFEKLEVSNRFELHFFLLSKGMQRFGRRPGCGNLGD